jgi:hypothetical protein
MNRKQLSVLLVLASGACSTAELTQTTVPSVPVDNTFHVLELTGHVGPAPIATTVLLKLREDHGKLGACGTYINNSPYPRVNEHGYFTNSDSEIEVGETADKVTIWPGFFATDGLRIAPNDMHPMKLPMWAQANCVTTRYDWKPEFLTGRVAIHLHQTFYTH